MSHFADDKFEQLIDAARATADHDERVAAMQAADDYVADLVPYAPLNYRSLARCTDKRVASLTVTPQILPLLSEASISE